MRTEVTIIIEHSGSEIAKASKTFNLGPLSVKDIPYSLKLAKKIELKSKLDIDYIDADTGLIFANCCENANVTDINIDLLDGFFREMKNTLWVVTLMPVGMKKLKHPTLRSKREAPNVPIDITMQKAELLALEVINTYFDGDRAKVAEAAKVSLQQVHNWVSNERVMLKLSNGDFILDSQKAIKISIQAGQSNKPAINVHN